MRLILQIIIAFSIVFTANNLIAKPKHDTVTCRVVDIDNSVLTKIKSMF